MIELKYIASSGHEYDLKGASIKTRTADFHAWRYKPTLTKKNAGRVRGFTREAKEYDITFQISGIKEQRAGIVDALHTDFELDIRTLRPGKIVWGSWETEGFFIDSDTYPEKDKIHTANAATFYAPNPFWKKMTQRRFYEADPEEDGMDYPHDYPHDFGIAGGSGEETWQREFPFASDYHLKIFGPAESPEIFINGRRIVVYDTILSAESIDIDSEDMTVIKTLTNGTTRNLFDARGKEESVFDKLPGGDLQVRWDQSFGFLLTIKEERSEPAWT